jgi:hypothetical protein
MKVEVKQIGFPALEEAVWSALTCQRFLKRRLVAATL